MKRTAFIAVGVALAGVAAVLLYTTLTREAAYRRLIREGEGALAADQPFVAVEAFSGAIALKPDAMVPYLRRGEAYRRRGELTAALRDFRTAAQIDPSAPRPIEEIGDVTYALERYARAAESYEAYLRLDDRSSKVLYKLALSRFRLGNPGAAVGPLRQAIGIDDRFAEACYLLGVCLGQIGQPAEAVTSLERAVRLAPALLPPREELAHLLLTLKREPDAVKQLEALAALEPTRTDPLIEAGLIYARIGRTDLALAELNRAIERDPTQPRVYQAIGRMWLEVAEGRRDRVDRVALNKAIEEFDRGVRGPGATSEGLTLYGRALLLQGDVNGAQHTFSDAAAVSPVDPRAYRELSALAERRGDLVVARDGLVRYLAISTDAQDARDVPLHLGDLCVRIGDRQGADKWFRQAADALSDDPEAVARVARALLKNGDREGATAAAQRGLARSPGNATLTALTRQIGALR